MRACEWVSHTSTLCNKQCACTMIRIWLLVVAIARYDWSILNYSMNLFRTSKHKKRTNKERQHDMPSTVMIMKPLQLKNSYVCSTTPIICSKIVYIVYMMHKLFAK